MKLYRCDVVPYYLGGARVIVRTFEVLAETPRGYWIRREGSDLKRWTKKGVQGFAVETREGAIDAFIARQEKLLEKNVRRIRNVIRLAREKREEVAS